MLLKEKTALITGGASGIGAACSRLFIEEGASVVIADINRQAGEELAAEMGENCHFVKTDVRSEADVEAAVGRAVELFGQLDCAANCAGISGIPQGLDDMSLDNWQQVIDINLTSVFLCLKHQLKAMKKQGGGAIVCIASGAGLIPTPNMAGYCASKHGVLGLTKTAASENIKLGIRVNAILPGSTRTPMLEESMAQGAEVEKMILASVPCGRFGEAIEIAQNVAWLCSDRASYVSGESMCVDYATVCR